MNTNEDKEMVGSDCNCILGSKRHNPGCEYADHNEELEKGEQEFVQKMVDRFCGWRLPRDFHPDGGIMFMDVYDNGTPDGGKFEPTGTNLFTAEQAKEMIRFMLEDEVGNSLLTTYANSRIQEFVREVEGRKKDPLKVSKLYGERELVENDNAVIDDILTLSQKYISKDNQNGL